MHINKIIDSNKLNHKAMYMHVGQIKHFITSERVKIQVKGNVNKANMNTQVKSGRKQVQT